MIYVRFKPTQAFKIGAPYLKQIRLNTSKIDKNSRGIVQVYCTVLFEVGYVAKVESFL